MHALPRKDGAHYFERLTLKSGITLRQTVQKPRSAVEFAARRRWKFRGNPRNVLVRDFPSVALPILLVDDLEYAGFYLFCAVEVRYAERDHASVTFRHPERILRNYPRKRKGPSTLRPDAARIVAHKRT